MHNRLYTTELYRRYHDLLNATPEANIEGDVWVDEVVAVRMMQEVATVEGNTAIAMTKLAYLQDALHAVLLADGLGGSIEAAQRHIADVEEAGKAWEPTPEDIEARRAFAQAMREDYPHLYDPKKKN